LLNFVYAYRALFTFLALEFFCAWLIVENNQCQSTKFFNSSNRISARIISFSSTVREYLSLRDINTDLAGENADLRKKLEQRNQSLYSFDVRELRDPAIINRFDYVSAKVVNNSTGFTKNFITINKGTDAGIKPGMAVISAKGAVGKVKSVSKHYSVLISLLNIDEQVSSVIKSLGYFGTSQWDGVDPRQVELLYIPRHVKLHTGDTVVTSGYNAVFPEGVLVGVIKEVNLKEETPFYDIKVELAQDFGNLTFVEVIKSTLKQEKDSLEQVTIGEPK
ncbi:MAG TPA: rod shape-determining protein MreC, partial [Cyclobacteriaceae bacterium]|nr:rod shape-determining protein MreC [Cyclobacteriaceae bacterium]